MPPPAALDQLDAVADVAFGEARQRGGDVPFPGMKRDLVGGKRVGRGEQDRFDRAGKIIHQTARSVRAARSSRGAKGASCASSIRPCRASSSTATNDEASADRA